MAVKLKKRGKWYHAGGKNAHGILIPRHSIEISTKHPDLAKMKQAELELATEWPWPPRKPAAPTSAPPVPTPVGLTLQSAWERWMKLKEKKRPNTYNGYKTVKRFFVEPLAARGVTLVADLKRQHLVDLQLDWEDNQEQEPGTIDTWRRYSSGLLNWCVDNEHLKVNLWRTVKFEKEKMPTMQEIMQGKGKKKGIATLPIDLKGRDNWERIQAEAPAFIQRNFGLGGNPLYAHNTWLAYLEVMYHTGLRRCDALIFRPDKIQPTKHGGSYFCIQVKTGDPVTCVIPPALYERVMALPLLPWRGARNKDTAEYAGKYPFYDGSGANPESYMAGYLNTPLRKFGRALGMPQNLRPHRFRDSFSVNMLNLGLPLQDVSFMLGHRLLATTEKHYKPYVLSIHEALENRWAAAQQKTLWEEAVEAQPKKNRDLMEAMIH
ncbi:MAG: hypothetical protein C5B60_10990 [Chloroflexi bacterium]|nr:MAG: hypothetical protein C5B60_10990 [Chloroflexota bacterium]